VKNGEATMMDDGKRRRYTESFKRRAVALLIKSGKPVSEVAAIVGVERSNLQKWKKRFGPESPVASRCRGKNNRGISELSLLKQEMRVIKDSVEQLRAIMKKSYTLKYIVDEEP